ncbi:MAG: hypothetical protein JWO88_1714 [Frankiales bacterium]|jgi:hypothetical protein|nr:hypothetical protein [Frankiales bacterium]
MRRVTVVLPLIVLLAGCSAGAASTESAGSAGTVNAGAKSAAIPAAAPAVQQAVDKNKPVAVPRSLIRTADVELRVRDVKRAAADAEQLVVDAGGQVTDEQLDLHATDPTASMKLQVPPARLTATLNKLAQLGDEQSRRLGTDDVTDQVVDLDSRLATQRTSVARVRALLDRASSLTDVVRVEAELSRREADLESLQARARAVSGQVAMSEVTVQLTTGPTKATPATALGFTKGLHSGWDAFMGAARVTAATVGAALPFLPLLIAAAWIALWWRRRTATA